MHRIVIADDEPRICELIRRLIDWEGNGLELVSCVTDGMELMDAIRRQRPDIVITDIVMPRMTGLEVIRSANEEGLDCRFIVVSGHRDFSYVQHGIKYGATDYLLKPIDREEMNDTLRKICAQLEAKEGTERALLDMSKRLEESGRNLRRILLRGAFYSRNVDFSDVEETNRVYSVNFGGGPYLAAILCVEGSGEEDGDILSVAAGRAERAVSRCLEDKLPFFVVQQLGVEVSCILELADGSDPGALMKTVFRAAYEGAGIGPGMRITLGYGERVEVFSAIPESVDTAVRALRERVKIGGNRAIGPDRIRKDADLRDIWTRETEQNLSNAFDGLSRELYEKWLRGIAEKAAELPGAAWYELCERIGRAFDAAAVSHGVERRKDEPPTEKLLERSLERECPALLFRALGRPVIQRFEEIEDLQREQGMKPIRMAKEYIQAHFSETIRLEDVANHVYLHPAYLSRLFKESVGIGFSDYVANCRLDHARYLLTRTNDTIYEIALQVGYTEARAFSKFFQKNVGLKPTEYRRLYS